MKKKTSTKAQKQSKIEVTSINVTIGNKRFGLTLDEAKRLQSALNNALGYFSYANPGYTWGSGYINRTTITNTEPVRLTTTDGAANSVLMTTGTGGLTADITIPDATGYTGEPYVNA